jgi:hypothetical protein
MVSQPFIKVTPPKKVALPDTETALMTAEDAIPADQDIVQPRVLTPEAKRALAEAEERRKAREALAKRPAEVGGRDGPEPTRFGDWEKGGIASDF